MKSWFWSGKYGETYFLGQRKRKNKKFTVIPLNNGVLHWKQQSVRCLKSQSIAHQILSNYGIIVPTSILLLK